MEYLGDVLQYILGLIVIIIIWRIFKLHPQKNKTWIGLFGQGALFGGITLLVGIGLYQLPLLGTAPELLVFAFILSILFGLPTGGIGGLIVGSIWKHAIAPKLGGVIVALILLAITIVFAPFFLVGGY